jgi:hypothetical protein
VSLFAPGGRGVLHFLGTFLIAALGCGAATVNLIVLGVPLTLLQAACTVAYCLIPLLLAALPCIFVSWFPFRLIVVSVTCGSAVSALVRMLGPKIEDRIRPIAIYPCALVYAVLSWIVLIQ